MFLFQYGSSLPSVEVFVDSPSNPINVRDIFKDKKGVLFSVLGAFTPGCSQVCLFFSMVSRKLEIGTFLIMATMEFSSLA